MLPLPLIPVLKKFKVLSLSNAPILRGIKPETECWLGCGQVRRKEKIALVYRNL